MKSIRKRTYELLETSEEEDRTGRFVDFFLIILISANVLAVILESVWSLEVKYQTYFETFELVSVVIFIVEYLLRVWSCVEHVGIVNQHPIWGRVRYMLTPIALLDLIVILPFFLALLGGFDFRFLRVLRLLRVFRLTRYSSALRLLKEVFEEEAGNIGAALFILLMMVIMAASIVYLAEADAQPDKFGSIPDALWWAIITMTTIGYGDVVPITQMGKFFGALIGVISVGLVALPTGIIASGFNQALHQRKQEYSELIETVLEDGKITEEDHEKLRDARDKLGLSDREAAAILNTARHHLRQNPPHCPHCGKPIKPGH